MILKTLKPLMLIFAAIMAQAISLPAKAQTSEPMTLEKSFDGTVAPCRVPADVARRAWRVISQEGLVKDDRIAITVKFETLICENTGGAIGFRRAAASARAVNLVGGFSEFFSLKVIGFGSNSAIRTMLIANPAADVQSVTFDMPVSQFEDLSARLPYAGNRQASFIVYALGEYQAGDSQTGALQPGKWASAFGAYIVSLSEANKTLRFVR